MKEMDEILHILPYTLRRIFQTHPELFQGLLEIRLRVGQPVGIHYARGNYFLGKNGTKEVLHKNIWIVEQSWLTEVLDTISSYSLYAFEEEMRQGYVTIRGGHRVGIAGEITMEGEKDADKAYYIYEYPCGKTVSGLCQGVSALYYRRKWNFKYIAAFSAALWENNDIKRSDPYDLVWRGIVQRLSGWCSR